MAFKVDDSDVYHRPTATPVKDMKYDGGKDLAGLVYEDFPLAIKAVNRIGTFGARKYERNSWKTVSNGLQRYSDAMHRHLLDYNSGEAFDKESHLHHYAHYAWNVLATLQLILEDNGNKVDDLVDGNNTIATGVVVTNEKPSNSRY